jgi:subtilisin family serine protease
MPRFWSWLRHSFTGRPTTAFSRTPRRNRAAFETLEDRLAPSVSVVNDARRSERFHVDDALVAAPAPVATATATPYANQSFGALIGLDRVFAQTANRGADYSVAVLDTGIDYNHPDLGGGWGKRVIAGWDFVNNDADPMDDNGHGTHVAGIIGSSSAAYAGIAPEANLIALKVLGANGSGSYAAVEDALNWVIANQAKYNIVSINLSLGSGNFLINPYELLENEFADLKSQGVFISVAAGNGYYTYQGQQGLAFPGSSPQVVSVGAVWDGNFGPMAWGNGARDNATAPDRIASFSQRGPSLSILAPGAMIISTYLGGRYQAMAGTSMASPVIAGAAVLLHEALDDAGKSSQATQDGILALMRSTGVRLIDGDDENDNVVNTGLAFQRLNLAAAMQAVGPAAPPPPPANSAPTLAAIADRSIVAGSTLTIDLSAADINGDPITFSARVIGLSIDPGQAYRLKQSLGLYALNGYFTNAFGLNEKWLGGAGGAYFTLLPSGELRRWTGTAASTMAPANLIATLDPSFYDDPARLLNAQPGAVNPLTVQVAGNQLIVAANSVASGSYQVEVAASDGQRAATRTFTVALAAAPRAPAPINRAPVWTPIADQRLSPRQTSLTVPLSAIDPDGQAITYSARVADGSGIRADVVDNHLRLTLPAGYAGSFAVEVAASDGQLTASTSFHVAVGNTPPTLTVADRITAPAGATRVAIPIATNDADGDTLTIRAEAKAAGTSLASQLKATYGLTFAGSYFTGAYGLGEKWLKSADGLQFFCVLPNGELHKFTGSVAQLGTAATRIATLDASYHDDPSKLWNAPPAAGPSVTVAVSDGQIVLTLQTAYRGTVSVDVIVSDGLASVKKTVVVTFP